MTIGEYVALRQPKIFRKLMLMARFKVIKAPKLEGKGQIDRLMREKPGFYRDERLQR